MLAVFRGDAFHQVSAWTTKAKAVPDQPPATPPRGRKAKEAKAEEKPVSAAYRVSLVLEAYQISDALYGATTVFEHNDQYDHRDYKSIRPLLTGFNQVRFKKRLSPKSFLRPTKKTGTGDKKTVTKRANYTVRPPRLQEYPAAADRLQPGTFFFLNRPLLGV